VHPQLNNVLIIQDKPVATRFLNQWTKLVAAGNAMPPSLVTSNSTLTVDNDITLYFAATHQEAEFKPVLDLIAGAKEGILSLMFMPGDSPLLEALLGRVQQNDICVRGVVSRVVPTKAGKIESVQGQVIKSVAPAQSSHYDVLHPTGIKQDDRPSWAETEFNVAEMLAAHLIAIVHSKVIVIDPLSDNCAVITGSHNFSVSASGKNDENLVIVRGNKQLAQAYALHVNGVYDHYSWRAFLASGGDPNQIYQPLDGWKPGGSRAQELDFWMNDPIAAQTARTNVTPTRRVITPRRKQGARAVSRKPAPARKTAARASGPKAIHTRAGSRAGTPSKVKRARPR
jgi:hypothetical protein